MSSTMFDEKAYISSVLEKIYYDYGNSILSIIHRHYMTEIGKDAEKEEAILATYRDAGDTLHKSLYDILYFKINKAIDDGEMDVYYECADVEVDV